MVLQLSNRRVKVGKIVEYTLHNSEPMFHKLAISVLPTLVRLLSSWAAAVACVGHSQLANSLQSLEFQCWLNVGKAQFISVGGKCDFGALDSGPTLDASSR